MKPLGRIVDNIKSIVLSKTFNERLRYIEKGVIWLKNSENIFKVIGVATKHMFENYKWDTFWSIHT